ncbi:DUF1217 domain-containing protein [Thalassobius sp. S69A]|uniref:DUF1217 domain-containing protein n=1 Tax=unclassified Thalassovita TaxID=2619711 RepID=UPI000C116C3C|nr:flagellar protein [Paracoccaceae bacterium]MBT26117.1 flagellar protein [Paracoccaceae bacterium]
MSFQPIVPASGLVGWNFLERTYETQTEVFNSSVVITRDTEYFEANISKVQSAEDLVSDRRLMRVALGAFGLQDDINNTYFIRKILEEGTIEPGSLANKMSDSRYADFSEAFGFDLGIANTQLSDFADKIIAKYRAQEFEIAVGEQDEDMRLALNAQRELTELAESDASERARWFQIMGNTPLRTVMETALGLPDSFAQIDLDQQLEVFTEKAKQQLGMDSISDLSDDETMNKLVERFLLRSQVSNFASTNSASIALTLLQA